MILRNLIFNPEIVEQRLRAGMMSHHEQQASERGIQQQHHVLWLAYNGIVAQETSINSGTFSTDTGDNISYPNSRGSELGNDLCGLALNLQSIPETFQPRDLGLAAKPGHLTLGVIAMPLLGGGDCFFQRQLATKKLPRLPISQRIQRRDIAVACNQRLCLFN